MPHGSRIEKANIEIHIIFSLFFDAYSADSQRDNEISNGSLPDFDDMFDFDGASQDPEDLERRKRLDIHHEMLYLMHAEHDHHHSRAINESFSWEQQN